MATPTLHHTTARALIEAPLFARLAGRVARENAMPDELAQRIVEQALVFLVAAARNRAHRGKPIAPSALVDIGWHTFILYTAEYSRFCERALGGMVHHAPTDDGRPLEDPLVVQQRTLVALAATGYPVDEDLWAAHGADCNESGGGGTCTQCHQGCVDSP
ncbi:glycine-rich domain-containing protein [Mangrovactinospora gilvigrisea]|nr:hypothetical protein [Mangrovactinospora gilvigrisea]